MSQIFILKAPLLRCVKLRDVINAGGYAEVIDEASKKAADGAVKGKYAEVLRRAAKLCKSAMGNEIAEGLGAVQTLRNRIVHEKHATNLGVKEVGEVQGHIACSIALLGRFALEMDLPGKYTYLLPTVNIEIDSIALLHPSDS